MFDIIYKDESYRIMGASFEVCKEMGCGFVEPVYQECLEMLADNLNPKVPTRHTKCGVCPPGEN